MSAGSIEGILSERDIVRVLGERGPRCSTIRQRGDDAQGHQLQAVRYRLRDHGDETMGKFRHLPVVEGDRVVGLISIGDIVKWRVREYEMEQEALREYIKTA